MEKPGAKGHLFLTMFIFLPRTVFHELYELADLYTSLQRQQSTAGLARDGEGANQGAAVGELEPEVRH